MKLIRTIPKNDIDCTRDIINIAESDDIESLKLKGKGFAAELGCENPFWSNTLPIMGDKKIEDVKEFTLELPNKERFLITY